MSLIDSIALPLPKELEILEILWCRKTMTAKELYEVSAVRGQMSYRSLKTVLGIMQGKGLIEQGLFTLGKPVTYRATYSKSKLQQLFLDQLLCRLFQADLSSLLQVVLAHPQFQQHQTLYQASLRGIERDIN
jgi:predicted transcriptional regulator